MPWEAAASTDVKRDAKERSKYRGLQDKLTSSSFVSDLAIMLDAPKELKELSEALQRNDITVVRASQLIIRQIQIKSKSNQIELFYSAPKS